MATATKSKAEGRKSKAKANSRGPKPSITFQVVKRVGTRYGRGLPLEQALAAECNPKINLETWHKALQKDEKLSTQWAGARGKFLDQSVAKLAASKNLKFLCWLLERRHSSEFAKRDSLPAGGNAADAARATEIPDDIWKRAQELAKGGTNGK